MAAQREPSLPPVEPGRPPVEPDRRRRTPRERALAWIETRLELPLAALGLVWLVLLVLDLVRGLGATLSWAATIIWILFILDFATRATLTRDRFRYLRRNWLTAISLAIPALRLFRAAAVLRVLSRGPVISGMRLTRIVASVSRGMRSLRRGMRRRGFGYVLAVTAVVAVVGAAGILAAEGSPGSAKPGAPADYLSALWWSAMMLTTIGSDYWPVTAEGRILTFLLAVYGFAIFGYITATLASFFIGADAASKESQVVGAEDLADLRHEITRLQEVVSRQQGLDSGPVAGSPPPLEGSGSEGAERAG